ncbi:hypothetical protein AA313_de0208427 [Arthrobotrys entomopaga]|nr:hypothetical protein AA313_de0208427 [Arthrobotrys entomopaga]
MGEMPGADQAEAWLTTPPLVNLLEKFGGLGIVWEQRYYGKSVPPIACGQQPGKIDDNTPTEAFRFLDIYQGLADIKYFADRFNSSKHPDYDATASGSPWIMIGGSYAGMRASFMREKYPDTIFAAYASSAPVEVQVEVPQYYEYVAQRLSHQNPTCVKNFQSALRYIDAELGKEGESAETVKKIFLGLGGAHNTNSDFATVLTLPFQLYQRYGYSDLLTSDPAGYSIETMCEYINTDDMYTPSPKEGWEAGGKYHPEWIATRLAKWKGLTAVLNEDGGVDCGGYPYRNESYPSKGGCSLAYEAQRHASDDIAWMWQACTEFGYWQVANIGPDQIVSKYYNASVFQDQCQLQFVDSTTPKSFPKLPTADQTNDVYGGWLRPQTRTLYSWNELDPWTPLTLFSNNTNAPKNMVTNEIPGCEALPSMGKVFGWFQPNGTHCSEFFDNSDNVEYLDLLEHTFESWLQCFTPMNTNNNQTNNDGNGVTPNRGKHPGGQLPGGQLPDTKPDPDRYPMRFNATELRNAFNFTAVELTLVKAKKGQNHTNERTGKRAVRWSN